MKRNDFVIALSHCTVLLCLGLVYAWSVFKGPLGTAFSWNDTQLTWTFTICMSFFCVGGFLGAKLTRFIRHQIVVVAGGVVLLTGFVLASRVTSLLELYLSYGVLVGLAVGIIYNCILSAGNAWFAKKAGMMSGLFLMCFGSGGFIFGPLCNWLLAMYGWSNTFLYLGIGVFVVIVTGSFMVVLPAAGTGQKSDVLESYAGSETPGEMIRGASFWLYSLWTTLLSGVNMAIVAQVFTISVHVGLTNALSSFMVGLVSVFCGVGRFLFGTLYDRRGRRLTMRWIAGLMLGGAVLLTVCTRWNVPLALTGGLILMGTGYGGITPTNSNFVRDFYGTKHYGMNFSLVNFNLLPSVFIGQVIGSGLYMRTGSFQASMTAMAVMCAAGLVVETVIKKKQI